MSQTFERIKALISLGNVRISEHGYDELAEDNIFARDVVDGVLLGKVIEDYPNFGKGPCVLVLENDFEGKPFHAVWGIPKSETSPAVLVTAYRPEPLKWSADFLRRLKNE